jgi:hypothetical protein
LASDRDLRTTAIRIFVEGQMSASLTGLPTAAAETAPPPLAAAPLPPISVGAEADSASQMIVSTTVTEVSPPGYTQTVTTQANGITTTVITNEVGAVVSTSTSHTAAVGTPSGVSAAEGGISVWA